MISLALYGLSSLHCRALTYMSRIKDFFLFMIPAVSIVSFAFTGICFSEEKIYRIQEEDPNGIKITLAIICEEVKDGKPVNEGMIFSSDLPKITCFTEFDQIADKMTIYHCWYFKDNIRAKKMPLVLNPPRWATFSQIQPRETDKGPWRVEIVDQDGNVLQTLRFSIVD